MVFLRYEKFKDYIRLYPVTTLILLANSLVFVLLAINGGSTNLETLVRFGAMVNVPPFNGEYWRYFTAMFLHIGVEHWLFNSFAIFVFAPPLERIMGRLSYLALYIGSGLTGNLTSGFMNASAAHGIVSAGASGAIFGVYGAYIFIGLFRKRLLDNQSRKVIVIILLVAAVYSLIVPNVNLAAHLGGFICGFAAFPLLFPARHEM
ncbi:MAG TPA: rhomboid family intramembrane serine protease [Bacilli bacterium]